MSLPAQSVVVAHPGKQHAYQVVLALQKAGLLHQFIAGVYFKLNEFPYRLVRCLPSALRQRAERELNKRRLEELDERLITSVPYFELLSRPIGNLPWLIRVTEGRSGFLFVNCAGDWYVRRWMSRCAQRPAVLYCFLGSALRSFRQARRMGILTVLDVPSTLKAPKTLADERRRLGMSARYTDLEPRLRAEVFAADRVLVPSEAVADSVIALGVPPERVFTLPFGVDLTLFRPGLLGHKVNDGKFRALFVGKFDLRKGVHHLLAAWRDLTLPNKELVIVGPPGDPDFVRAMRLKYAGQFVERGNVPHAQLAELFAQSDVFVFPSLAEGSALVTYEALASGLPCIVTQEAGSVVRNGVEGFLVPVGDTQALGKRILQLYQDKDLRQRMAFAARQRAEEFSWQRYHTRLVQALKEVMAERQYAPKRKDTYAT